VRTSVARVRAAAYVPHRDAIRGFVYEVATGRLREVT
jgi:carbonic anhydrase